MIILPIKHVGPESVEIQTKINSSWKNVKRIGEKDTNVWKYVFENPDAVAEAVLYKYPTFEQRTVICCSTQSGCPVGCRFCGAGDYFVRSLSTQEIVDQTITLLDNMNINASNIKRFQIMFMSMGEPLLNWKNLKPALYQLYSLYPSARLLISTIGPKISYNVWADIINVSIDIPNIGLQFSVHESTDEARNKLIPLEGKMNLSDISYHGLDWFKNTGRSPFFNYCAHPNNTSSEDVNRLLSFFNPGIWSATISVICERDEHVAAANERQRHLASSFMDKMLKAGYDTRMFDPAGQDSIGGGCGQLWFVQNWMKTHNNLAKASIGFGKDLIHTPR